MALASLVVLPLWGWLRRQFDNRVALDRLPALRPSSQADDPRPAGYPRPNVLVLAGADAVLGLAGGIGTEALVVLRRRTGLGLGRPHPHRRLAVGGAAGIVVRFSLAGRRGASAAAGAGGAAVRGHAARLGRLDERHLAARLSALGVDPSRPRGNDRGSAHSRKRSTRQAREPAPPTAAAGARLPPHRSGGLPRLSPRKWPFAW